MVRLGLNALDQRLGKDCPKFASNILNDLHQTPTTLVHKIYTKTYHLFDEKYF